MGEVEVLLESEFKSSNFLKMKTIEFKRFQLTKVQVQCVVRFEVMLSMVGNAVARERCTVS